jgi:hypothetical protein
MCYSPLCESLLCHLEPLVAALLPHVHGPELPLHQEENQGHAARQGSKLFFICSTLLRKDSAIFPNLLGMQTMQSNLVRKLARSVRLHQLNSDSFKKSEEFGG